MLADKASELHFVAMKHHQVISVVEYIGDVFRAMTDSWEDSLLTVDKKMEEYAKVSWREGTVSTRLYLFENSSFLPSQHVWRNRLARSAVNRKVVGSSPTMCGFKLFSFLFAFQ